MAKNGTSAEADVNVVKREDGGKYHSGTNNNGITSSRSKMGLSKELDSIEDGEQETNKQDDPNESIIQINQSASNLNQLLHELELENQMKEGKKVLKGEEEEEVSKRKEMLEDGSSHSKCEGENDEEESGNRINHREMDEEGSPRSLTIAEDETGAESRDGNVTQNGATRSSGQDADIVQKEFDTNDRKNDDHNFRSSDDVERLVDDDDELKRSGNESEGKGSGSEERIINGSEEVIEEDGVKEDKS